MSVAVPRYASTGSSRGPHGAENSAKTELSVCRTRQFNDHAFKKSGVIPRLLVPGTIPGGYPEYPDPLRGGFLTVVMN